jgi:copper(I)-binding protein
MKRLLVFMSVAAGAVSAAQAHVVLERGEASPGSSYKATLIVPHGCAGSATTRLTVSIPEGMIAVKPRPKLGWTIEMVNKPYGKTYEFMHGIKLSDGVREISWSGRLENSYFDEFAFSGFLADSLKPGEVLYFPAVQECERGVERWVEIPAAGQDSHSLKSPAPALRLVASTQAPAATFRAGALVIEQPWFRATPKGADVAGGYMKITNTGNVPDTLVGGTLEGTRRFEVHEMVMQGDVMRMRPVSGGIEIKPGETVELKPGGYHVMGIGLAQGLVEGQTIKGTLQFKNAGAVSVEFPVRSIGGDHKH